MRYAGERQAVCHEREDPRPAPNEVLIKMQAAGICGSDLHLYRRPDARFVDRGRVPGHDPAGVIAELGADVRGWSVGDRVTAYFRQVCGTSQGRQRGCQGRQRPTGTAYHRAAGGRRLNSHSACAGYLPKEPPSAC